VPWVGLNVNHPEPFHQETSILCGDEEGFSQASTGEPSASTSSEYLQPERCETVGVTFQCAPSQTAQRMLFVAKPRWTENAIAISPPLPTASHGYEDGALNADPIMRQALLDQR
jgi:hypothetical protein